MNPDIIHALEVAAIVVAGTLTGSELAVAVFFHPRISRLEDAVHIQAAQTLAKVLSMVMSFWYPLTLLLALAVTFVAHATRGTPWWLALASTALFALISVYSVLLPVPINNPGCPLAARHCASKLARFAPALGFASCHPGRVFSYRSDSSRCIMCLLNQSPNHRVDRTAATPEDVGVVRLNSRGSCSSVALPPAAVSHSKR